MSTGKSWITPEKKAIKKAFSWHIREGVVPCNGECREAVEQYHALKARAIPTIKTHVLNEINREKRRKQLRKNIFE